MRRERKPVRRIESFRPDDDVAALLAVALGKFNLNKNRLVNACVRHALGHHAGKRIVVNGSDYERKVFATEP